MIIEVQGNLVSTELITHIGDIGWASEGAGQTFGHFLCFDIFFAGGTSLVIKMYFRNDHSNREEIMQEITKRRFKLASYIGTPPFIQI